MIFAATLWSIAGVFTRHLDEVRGFEITFWRSLFAALFVVAVLAYQRKSSVVGQIRKAGLPGLFSGLCWGVFFISFMLSLTLTTVANTLVVCSLTPFMTVVLARLFLKQRTPMRTWIAIAIAFFGIVVMFAGSMA